MINKISCEELQCAVVAQMSRGLRHSAKWVAELLAEVYLELKGGKERRLDLSASRATVAAAAAVAARGYGPRPRPLPERAHEAEQVAHLAFLEANLKDRSLWEAYGLDTEKASAA